MTDFIGMLDEVVCQHQARQSYVLKVRTAAGYVIGPSLQQVSNPW